MIREILFSSLALLVSEKTLKAQQAHPLTYYTAKQALARLVFYLREQGRPEVEALFQAQASPVGYVRGESLTGVVGGWIFIYRDEEGRILRASLNCWGEVKLREVSLEALPPPLELDTWVLDDLDAHWEVLDQGAEVKGINRKLNKTYVTGRGIRPVWRGNWRIPDIGAMAVDAQTGEIYLERGKLQAIRLKKLSKWDGGFKGTSPEALKTKLDYPYWWPRAYRIKGRYVYNRELLRKLLRQEEKKQKRDASSWASTGLIYIVLGNWVRGIEDLGRAVGKDPGNEKYRQLRGISYLCIRDLDKAASDFRKISENREELWYLSVVRGERSLGGLSSFTRNVDTKFGSIPWQVWIGPLSVNLR